MNTFALQNINILQSLKENDVFSFNGYNLIINNKDNSNIEYGLYFTFHEIFTLFDMDSRSRNNILRDLNSSIDNLYENKFFLNIIEESDDIKNIMDDICSKVDILTEKYFNKSFCSIIAEELYRKIMLISRDIINNNRQVQTSNDESSSDGSDDEFVKED